MDALVLDAKVVQELDEKVRTELAKQISGNPVVTRCQTPLQCHHFSVASTAAISGSPGSTSWYHVCPLLVWSNITRRPSALHCKRVEVGLDGRTDLVLAQRTHIVLEVAVINASHISLHMTRFSVHTHEACAKEGLVVANAVEWRHQGVLVSFRRIDRHLDGCIEGFVNLFIGISSLLHFNVARTLSLCSCQV